MTTRDLIKSEIDQVEDHFLSFLLRIIRALLPKSSTVSVQQKNQERDDSWREFLQDSYGIFRDDPLERAPQGTLEIREAFE